MTPGAVIPLWRNFADTDCYISDSYISDIAQSENVNANKSTKEGNTMGK